jgi:hypothetical protein
VRVLLSLGDVELARAAFREHFGHRRVDVLFLEDDRAGQIGPVARHRRQVVPALDQTLRELPRPVGSEVEEDRRIAVLQPRPPRERDRLDELIGHVPFVLLLNDCYRV